MYRSEGETRFCRYIKNNILIEYECGVCCKVTYALSLEEFLQILDGYYRGDSCVVLKNCLDILDNPFCFHDFIILFSTYMCVPVHAHNLVVIRSPKREI